MIDRLIELNGENLSRYSNKIESVSLRKCPYDHRLVNEAYLSAITATNISRSLTYKVKKGKVFPYSLPSVGPGADPGVQAVSPQVT